MTIQEILEAHIQSIRNGRCSCEERGPKRTGLEHRSHLAEVLEKHMQEREAAHRREWADYIAEWHATVGAPICHVDAVVQALRSDRVPFGKEAPNA